MAQIFDVAEDLLMVMDFKSKDRRHQNEIDSEFYFRAFCERWIEGVKALRLRFFRRLEPPVDWEVEEDLIPLFPAPPAAIFKELVRFIDQRMTRFDADVQLSKEDLARLKAIGINAKNLVGWWRVFRLGQPYNLTVPVVWEHLVSGKPMRLPFLSIDLAFNPPVLTLRVYDPGALDYRQLGLDADDPIVRGFWQPPQDRKRYRRPEASQEAGHLIRTWTTFCLELLATMPARRAVIEWDEHLPAVEKDLSWPTTSEEIYRQDKNVLRRRLQRLFHHRRLKPGTILSA